MSHAGEAELVAAVEAGETPLVILADWLEERGDERAAGVRWLADNDRRPRHDFVTAYERKPEPPTWKWHLTTHGTMPHQIPWTGEPPTDVPGRAVGGGVLEYDTFAAALDGIATVLSHGLAAGNVA